MNKMDKRPSASRRATVDEIRALAATPGADKVDDFLAYHGRMSVVQRLNVSEKLRAMTPAGNAQSNSADVLAEIRNEQDLRH